MKRYILEDPYINILEDDQGDWVRYDDVVELLGKLGHDASVHGFHSRILKLESVECNCEEQSIKQSESKVMYPKFNHFWICPAHGYKRL